jgi:DNA protecting protein DprA
MMERIEREFPHVSRLLGIDEAGRGPLAGPCVVAGVVLPIGYDHPIIFDSKQLSAKKRMQCFDDILRDALWIGVIAVTPHQIDVHNIYQATKSANVQLIQMAQAELVLTDAMPIQLPDVHVIDLIKGDTKSVSIAAASIIAKVVRDDLMEAYDRQYPGYGFAQHKGYPTKAHVDAIQRLGVLPIHRKTYGPGARSTSNATFYGRLSFMHIGAYGTGSTAMLRASVFSNTALIKRALLREEAYDPSLSDGQTITRVDPDYPTALLALDEPPYVLYYRGDRSLIHQSGVAIVGSRQMTPYAQQATHWIASALSHRYVIVSGLAKGVDATAHAAALINGRTVAVLGCGIDRIYPASNASLYQQIITSGLILSEYPGLTPPLPEHFPWRNRLVAALSTTVVVTQADFKSGSMITVRQALALGKDVATIPYRIGDKEGEACNALIQDGAQLIMDKHDLDLI